MNHNLQALCFIICNEQVSVLSKILRKHDLSSTKFLAKGTVSSHFLHSLGITSDRRTIVEVVARKETIDEVLEEAAKKLKLDKPGHGIAYITEIIACSGMHGEMSYVHESDEKTDGGETMFHKISVIVERGNAEEVMEAARVGGARGGTIIHGRGSTGAEAQKIFGIEIEPEKEIVMILTPEKITRNVIDEIVNRIHIDEPGKGILFVEQLVSAKGLFEKRSED